MLALHICLPQPIAITVYDKWLATFFESSMVSVQDCITCLRQADLKFCGRRGKPHASGEADQILCVGKMRGFIEIIDAPDQFIFCIAPCAKVRSMQITD